MTTATRRAAAVSFLNVRILKEVLLVSGGQYLGAGLSLLATVLAAHVLTVEDFGLLSVFAATMTLTNEITGKSFDSSVVRFSSFYLDHNPARAFGLIKQVLALRFLLAAGLCLLGFLLAGPLADGIFHNPAYRRPIALGFVGAVGMSMWGYGQAVLQAYQYFGLHSCISFINGLGKLTAVLLLISLGLCRSEWVQSAHVATAFATVALTTLLVPKEFLRGGGTEASLMGKFLQFGKWPFAANLFVILYTHLCFFLLLYFSGAAEVAVYAGAWRLVFAIDLLAYSLIVVFLPKASRITNTSDFVSYTVQTLKISLPMCVLLLPLAFCSQTVMAFVYPEQYAGGARILQLLLVGTLIALPAHPVSLIMLAVNKPAVFAFAALVTLAFSTIAGFLLIPTYEGLGAAVVAALAKSLYGVLLLVFSYLSMKKSARPIHL
ncbi:MAG: oligosaccharide flippase family protein [Sedimentisphaerales bacterium]|nr:oligosaccharide flippase family protein [Sedimentisphaerales bacterium]